MFPSRDHDHAVLCLRNLSDPQVLYSFPNFQLLSQHFQYPLLHYHFHFHFPHHHILRHHFPFPCLLDPVLRDHFHHFPFYHLLGPVVCHYFHYSHFSHLLGHHLQGPVLRDHFPFYHLLGPVLHYSTTPLFPIS